MQYQEHSVSNVVPYGRSEGETPAPRCLRVSPSMQTIMIAAAVLAAGASTAASVPLKRSTSLAPAQQAALLRPAPGPDCAFKPPAGLNPGDARLMRLEFEQQCYRLAAMAIRYQLMLLKGALGRTDKPDEESDCTLKSVPPNISEKDARIMHLDYEGQCYRQTEDIQRARLSKLQASVVRSQMAAASDKRTTSSRKRSIRPLPQPAPPPSPVSWLSKTLPNPFKGRAADRIARSPPTSTEGPVVHALGRGLINVQMSGLGD